MHKARILSSGDIVAVKIIPVSEQDEIAGIQREIAMLRECNHPNIVKYYVRRSVGKRVGAAWECGASCGLVSTVLQAVFACPSWA